MIKKVLVVDDSELIHNMYRIILQKYQGCILLKAMNGREALEKLSMEKDIDLILLDINMPVMNGLQFLETVRKNGQSGQIPIIIISTEGKEDDTLRGLSLGARGYIVKPFRSQMLHDLIDSLFKSSTSPSSLRSFNGIQ
jgi:two-component system, chemotaxis family, chemotaxis protein CheY